MLSWQRVLPVQGVKQNRQIYLEPLCVMSANIPLAEASLTSVGVEWGGHTLLTLAG